MARPDENPPVDVTPISRVFIFSRIKKYEDQGKEGLFVYYESIKRELSKRLIFECRCDARLKGVVYYESINRELNKRLIFDSRCDARLKAESEGCTLQVYTMCREEP